MSVNIWRLYLTDPLAGVNQNTYQLAFQDNKPLSPYIFAPPITTIDSLGVPWIIADVQTALIRERFKVDSIVDMSGNGVNLEGYVFNDGVVIPSYEVIDTGSPTVPDVSDAVTEIKITTSGTPIIIATLNNGTYRGQMKEFLLSTVTGTDSYKLLIPNFVNGTACTFTTAGQSAKFMWTDISKWILTGGSGAFIS